MTKMATRSRSPSRRQSKKKQKRPDEINEIRGNDEMRHNRLDGLLASDFDYFREIQPKLRDLSTAKAALQIEVKKVEEALGKIVECLEEHGEAVSVVGDNMEREQEREKEMEELRATTRQLWRLKDEERTERDKEIIGLKNSATAGQRKEEELKKRQSQLESEYGKKVEELRIAEEANRRKMEEAFQKKLEQEIQRQVGDYSSKMKRLEHQTKALEKEQHQLREEKQHLEKSLEEKELALEGLRSRNKGLTTKLEEGRNDFAEGEKTEQF
jgi:chromosome segregation ATPase